MKKYLMGIIAIVLAVGLSAFTNKSISKNRSGLITHWFIVSGSKATGPNTNSFINSEVSYYGTSNPAGCTGSGNYCNAEFGTGQVNDDGHGNVTLNGAQPAMSFDVRN